MLHPRIRALLTAQRAAALQPVETLPVDQARHDMRASVRAASGEPVEVGRVEDHQVPGPGGDLPIRVYTPARTGPFTGLVYFHGGGFVIGDLETHDPVCRRLCREASAVVCAVDYRLAPEHRFPAAAEDAIAATRWMAREAAPLLIDPERLVVAGDSAGGTLAAVSALAARDAGEPRLAAQVLVYPVTDHYAAGYASYHEYATGCGLTRDAMVWFWDHYLPDPADREDPRASPLRASDLRGLPRTLVITAEYDVLRDEGVRYAARLREAGVAVTHTHCAALHHGFLRLFAVIEEAGETIRAIATWLRSGTTNRL